MIEIKVKIMFALVVSLYRACGRPQIVGGVFSYRGEFDREVFDLATACRSLDARFGSINELDQEQGVLSVEYQLPASSYGAFFDSFSEFVRRTPTLGKGKVPDSIYIIDGDWFPLDRDANEKYQNIVLICEFIDNLCALANWADKTSSESFNSLYFTLPADFGKPPRNVVIPTAFEEGLIDLRLNGVAIVSAVVSGENKDKLHIEERRLLLRIAIADVAERCYEEGSTFAFVVKNWAEVVRLYWNSLQLYVHGFSFDKIRSEIAKAEIEFAGKLSSALGDIAGKLLALPVSLAAIAAIGKLDLGFELYSGVVGMFLVSAIMFMVLWNQWLQVERLRHSFDVVFGQYRSKIDSYPRSLRDALRKTILQVDRQAVFLKFTFCLFMIFSAIPFLISLMILDFKFGWPFFDFLKGVILYSWGIDSKISIRFLI